MIKREISSDHLTPILCFKAVGGPGCCILESAYEAAGSNGQGKSSFIGIRPFGTFRSKKRKIEIELHGEKRSFEGDPIEALKEFSKDRRTFGFMGYEGDCFFHLYQTVFLFDHERHKLLCTHEGTEEELNAILEQCLEPQRLRPLQISKNLDVKVDQSREEFAALVEKAKESIRAGDVFQVVLSRTFQIELKASPFDIYRALRQTNPAPYLFFFQEEDFALAGASPELLISVQNGVIESMPIAGTSPRDKDPNDLLKDPKECAEHVMLVDLARNDVGAVAAPGSVQVAEFKTVKTFPHVHHIVSRVVGTLKPSLHALDALQASFPAGTLSGAPKIRAIEIIEELEKRPRGSYGGAVVTLDEKGNLTSCISIRMAMIRKGYVEVRAGAGIVFDSEGEKEALETEHKAKGVIKALELAEGSLT